MIDEEVKRLASLDSDETTPFQMVYFLVGRECTNQAKMRRCIAEISTRIKSIEAANLEMLEISDRSELLAIEADRLDNSASSVIHKRMANRKIHANNSHCRVLSDKIVGWEKETKVLHDIYKSIEDNEPLKPWNDFNVQMEYWSRKLSDEITIRSLFKTPLDLDTARSVLALPDEAPVKQETLRLTGG